ncbi:hypothetical protein SLEP1_g56390 [Rubroshorea leprosula]|uniref:Uncharacterized protein n=2 Tax=Rubroshorea leprosula TaxID=152421 RepID=A0AAV5MIC3_9ROSI|nr:hypothetical protein SLEP1_g56390 [Rubroshorea leprosula]
MVFEAIGHSLTLLLLLLAFLPCRCLCIGMETAVAPAIETVRDYDAKLFNRWDFDVEVRCIIGHGLIG